jgi:hypothetical protein
MRIYFTALTATIIMFLANYLGIQGYYESVYGYDSFVHFLGGISIGFCIFVGSHILNSRWLRTWGGVLFGVLVVGISWEIFEAYYEISLLPGQTYWADTIKDILMDIIGGSVAYMIGKKRGEHI